MQKYKDSHDILISGDLNEDLSKDIKSGRSTALKIFMQEIHLVTNHVGETFIDSNGVEKSEIASLLI